MVTLFKADNAKAPFRAAQRSKVSVGGVEISRRAISAEVQNQPAGSPLDAWTAAARALAVREMLLQEARRLGHDPEPQLDGDGRRETQDEALIRGLIDGAVATPEPDEAACRRYYQNSIARFRSADLYEAAHILIAARQADAAAFAAARQRAAALCQLLAAQPDTFPQLAEAHSDCPSARAGGNLGQIKQGDTTAEFEAALVALAPGTITPEPVRTRYGLHVIRLDRRIAGRVLPFAVVRDQIAAYISERSRRAALAQYLARLASRSDIVGVELPTPADLRVC